MPQATEELSPDDSISSLQHDTHRRMWERSKCLTTSGQSNSALWSATPVRGRSPQPTLPDNFGASRLSSTVNKLTSTLPLPGDGHNPLSVLVELSDSAQYIREGGDVLSASAKEVPEEAEYYAPLERTLKEEAPHIMSLINPHE